MTLDRVCINDFYGPNCDIYCLENCDIDRCDGVDCGTNQLCVNLVFNYTCVCMPGFTGTDCLTNIDDCATGNCNNGTCMDGIDTFTCVCDPRYTGQFCETQLDSYQLIVTIHSFINPGGMCADDECRQLNTCCELRSCPSPCEYYFSLCQQPSDAQERTASQRNCDTIVTGLSASISNGTSFTDSVFGRANPVIFTGVQQVSLLLHVSDNYCTNPLQPDNGRQLSIEILDSGDRLIDRFAIDLVDTSPFTAGEIHTGVFGFAEIELTLDRVCINNFYGPNCDIFCLENCDGCDGVDCGGTNQLCVNLVSNYICVCIPGFTGTDCTIDIDECTAVNCNNGECINGNASFTCVCDPRYFGRFCETQLDSYQLMVTIHSFSNPGGMCADDECGPDICCERGSCPSTCEYYFSLCQRPSGTEVSTIGSASQGNCVETSTGISGSISDGASFTDSVFGSVNPIVLSGVQWVSYKSAIPFYMDRCIHVCIQVMCAYMCTCVCTSIHYMCICRYT